MPWGIGTMNSSTVSRIHDFTLEARDLLETELSEQLEGIYGLLPDGTLKAADAYPALSAIPDAHGNREMIEIYVNDENAGGVGAAESRKKLVREASFTWLNRFVAFRMMETRNLIRQTVSRGLSSNAFLRWLTEPGREDEYALHEEGELPADGCGEGPRHRAYRHFILWQCGELSKEIRVLFDPDSLPSRLFPRPRVIAALIDMMNAPDLSEAWAPGNEETVGWVYQYYNEPDLVIFKGENSIKVPLELIGPRTQQYTPNWVVNFLVHNTLGRLWMRMHPDSSLKDELEYLIPVDEDSESEPLRPVGDITIIDPACGTMHFGVVAFDILVKMYKEELRCSGRSGWPEKASVTKEDEIASSIIARNIFGVDIDLRAVQLAALALLIKAKMFNPHVHITESNLSCATLNVTSWQKFESFIKEIATQKPFTAKLLETIRVLFKASFYCGSLLKPAQEITRIVREAREWVLSHPSVRDTECYREIYESGPGYWKGVFKDIERNFGEFLALHKESSLEMKFFTDETSKGFRLSNILSGKYDIVLTNPPYLDSRDYHPTLKSYLDKYYPESKRNLYSICTERFLGFLKDTGRMGIITGQSFMFISSFESFRKNCLSSHKIECLLQFDYGLFAARVDTAAFVLKKELDSAKRDEHRGTYFRLVKELDCEAKCRRFETVLSRLRQGDGSEIVFRYVQKDFDAIPGSPWVYWVGEGIRRLFVIKSKVGDSNPVCIGMRTGDNKRFLRFWWEVGFSQIGLHCKSADEAVVSRRTWFPYMKGGGFKRWYGNQERVVEWHINGLIIKENTKHVYPQLGDNLGWKISNENFYFRRGVTWTDLTSGRFSARLSPGGFIFDVKGSSAFPDNIPLILGLLNSSFAHYALNLLNPTVSFQVGDLARLPVPDHSSTELESLVEKAIELAKDDSRDDETTYDFIAPPDWKTGIADVTGRRLMLDEIEQLIDEEVYSLYGLSEGDRAAIEMELSDEASGEDSSDEVNESHEDEDDEAQESQAALTREALARKWISYAVGVVMGRFLPGIDGAIGRGRFNEGTAERLRSLCDADAVMVMDEGHSDDLPACVMEALVSMHGDDASAEIVREGTGGQGDPLPLLRGYLERSYFKNHIQQYKKRPVYWLLQSPKKKYGVWLFHERMTHDTLYRIKTEYVEHKIKLLEAQTSDLLKQRDSLQGRERRLVEKKIAAHNEISDDIREFRRRFEYVINERHFAPHIDDGVLLTMAPLWELIPSWQSEPKKAWEALSRGDYDWAGQAMDHWPERVREKCRSNRSYAIAHRLTEGDE